MKQVYIALGSNINEPIMQLKSAINSLAQLNTCRLGKQSSFYQTKAIGPQQPDFINAVVELHTNLAPHELLNELHRIEKEHFRTRTILWGPRTLDLDIVLFEGCAMITVDLVIPHPRMHERNFVLVPLYEIAGDIEIPGKGFISGLIHDNQQKNNEEYVQKIPPLS